MTNPSVVSPTTTWKARHSSHLPLTEHPIKGASVKKRLAQTFFVHLNIAPIAPAVLIVCDKLKSTVRYYYL